VTKGGIRKGRFQSGSDASLSRAAPPPQLSADTISVLRSI